MSARFEFNQIAAVLEANGQFEAAAAHRQIAKGEDANEAFGLRRQPGQRSLATEFQTTCRNQFVREAAAKLFPGLSKLQQAKELSKGLGRYHDGGWQRGDCNKTECPNKPGRPEHYYWHILKARAHALKWPSIYALL